MQKLERLWRPVESTNELYGARLELERIFGDEIRYAEPFLKRLPYVAEIYPCDEIGWSDCPRKIVVHPSDRIVAICGNDPPACETLALSFEDAVCYEFDLAAFWKRISRLLHLAGSPSDIPGHPGIWAVGFVAADGVSRTPVFSIPNRSRAEQDQALDYLLGSSPGLLVLLVPTLRFVDANMEARLKLRHGRLLALQDVVGVEKGELIAPLDLRHLLESHGSPPDIAPLPKTRYRAPRSIGSEEAVRAVRTYIEKRGWGITTFATQCGTRDRTITNFFKAHKVRRTLFEAMAKEIGVSVEQLLHGDLPPR